MASPSPMVSIVMPVYDTADTLEESVASCLDQTLSDFELLLVDDGSEPVTAEVAIDLSRRDSRIEYLRISHTGVPGAVRNAGLQECHGRYVQFLDADDLISPSKLAVQTAALLDAPDTVAYSDYLTFSEDASGHRSFDRLGPAHDEHWPESLARQFLTYTVLHRFLFPRQVLAEHGAFDPALTHAEDLDLWLRLLIRGVRFSYQSVPLAYYRQHASHSLGDPDGEIASRRRVVGNCRIYLEAAGLADRYDEDLILIDRSARVPAWVASKGSPG